MASLIILFKMPTGFEIEQGHWDLIIRFIGAKAAEDGVVTEGEMVDLMRQYWNLISDKAALIAEMRTRDDTQKVDEIAKLKARLAELER
jgi:hypothetical protein